MTYLATTCTPSPIHMKMMLQASDTIPMNFAFTGKGNTAAPEGLIDIIEAGIQMYLYLFMCLYLYVDTYLKVCKYTYMYVCIYVCFAFTGKGNAAASEVLIDIIEGGTQMYLYLFMCLYLYVNTYVYIYVYICIYIYMSMNTCMDAYIYVLHLLVREYCCS
jgi:hypothetical protein